jgi:hypothetical protein
LFILLLFDLLLRCAARAKNCVGLG